MQLFSAIVFSKNLKKKFGKKVFYATFQCYSVFKKLKIVGQTPFFYSPAHNTAHSPELIFYIMKSRDQKSVLLSMGRGAIRITRPLVLLLIWPKSGRENAHLVPLVPRDLNLMSDWVLSFLLWLSSPQYYMIRASANTVYNNKNLVWSW